MTTAVKDRHTSRARSGSCLPAEILGQLHVEKGDTLYQEMPSEFGLLPLDATFARKLDVAAARHAGKSRCS